VSASPFRVNARRSYDDFDGNQSLLIYTNREQLFGPGRRSQQAEGFHSGLARRLKRAQGVPNRVLVAACKYFSCIYFSELKAKRLVRNGRRRCK
jgi:hypothetical protein